MPIIKSAKKRVRTSRKATVRNAKTKREFKSAVKKLQKVLKAGKKATSEDISKAQSAIDKAVKKNVIHRNKAARISSQLAKDAKAGGVKLAKKAAKPAAKPAPKKAPAKKQPSKKAK